MTVQLPFHLPYAVPKTVDDFFVSACNEEAFSWIQKPTWPFAMVLLTGPEGCGKTHMAHIFAKTVLKAKDFKEADILLLPQRAVIEDIDECRDEQVLFHLFNYAKESRKQILLTARAVPPFKLPDLKTRMSTVPVIPIHAPDDMVMMALLCKAFTDRQVDVDSDVITYLMTHLDRSYQAVHQIVAAVDTYALSKKRRITIPLIKEAVAHMQDETLL